MDGCNIKKVNYQTKMQKSNFFEKGPAIQTVGEGNLRKDGRMPGGECSAGLGGGEEKVSPREFFLFGQG